MRYAVKMARPQEHGEETRLGLLEAAGRILAQEGPEAVTNRRLASELGTSTRAIYSLFGSKEGLLRALFHEGAATMARYHEAVDERADPTRELPELALAYRHAARERPDLYGLLFEGTVPGFTPTEEDVALARRSFDRVVETVRRCVESGRFPGRAPEDIALQLWGLVHGLASLELRGHLGPPDHAEARWHDAMRTAIDGYRHPPPAS
jgi:AcrR family transcriptional regulator